MTRNQRSLPVNILVIATSILLAATLFPNKLFGKDVAQSPATETKAVQEGLRFSGEEFLSNLQNPTRQVAVPEGAETRALKKVLLARLPLIERVCGTEVSLSTYKLGFGVIAAPELYRDELRLVASRLGSSNERALTGVTPECRVALRGFSVAVMQVYLGQDWRP